MDTASVVKPLPKLWMRRSATARSPTKSSRVAKVHGGICTQQAGRREHGRQLDTLLGSVCGHLFDILCQEGVLVVRGVCAVVNHVQRVAFRELDLLQDDFLEACLDGIVNDVADIILTRLGERVNPGFAAFVGASSTHSTSESI